MRLKPLRLPHKLLKIRLALGLTPTALLDRLQVKELTEDHITGYENGRFEPPAVVILRYARLAGITVEVLIDDEQDLPTIG